MQLDIANKESTLYLGILALKLQYANDHLTYLESQDFTDNKTKEPV